MTSRAARRRAQREAAKHPTDQRIQLANPVADHFPAFIFGNATKCEKVLERDSALGQTLVLCGAGPSLREHIAEYRDKGTQCWGVNSALTWLQKNGHNPTHGFTVDQTPEMVVEWWDTPDVEYLVASTIHPHLTDLLIERGKSLRFFHNYVGIRRDPVEIDGQFVAYEDWLYAAFYPTTVMCGSGLNGVNRAVDAALYAGFEKIYVLGADCAIRTKSPIRGADGSAARKKWLEEETEMHADGGHALASGATPVTVDGYVDGRHWTTKPDMLISATWLMKTEAAYNGRVELIGDTLPVALRGKPDAFLDRVACFVDKNGKPMPMPVILPRSA